MHVCVCVCVCYVHGVCVCVCVCVCDLCAWCMYVYVCMHVCMCVVWCLCLSECVRVSNVFQKFPVKLTEPLTGILYITSDKQHMEDLKHAIHVKEINEGLC